MPGTLEGGRKAAATNKTKYGPDFYAKIGGMGGKTVTENTRFKGFASDRTRASWAGVKGGIASRRGKAK